MPNPNRTRIRIPRRNPGPGDAPDAPEPTPEPLPASAAPPEPSLSRTLGSYGTPSIDQHDAKFIAASDAVFRKKGVRVSPLFIKAVMGVESGENGNYPLTACRVWDGHPGPRSCGPMQIKWPNHKHRCPSCLSTTLAGHIELATHIIGDTMKEHGLDEYGAYTTAYLTSDDSNGNTQASVVAGLRRRVRDMERDGGTTPAPAPESLPVVFGRVPKPENIVYDIVLKAPPGWTDYGPRSTKAVVLHRMEGSNAATHFRAPSGHGRSALTDWGVTATRIECYNDPDSEYGNMRSPWASDGPGPSSGDGIAFDRKYGAGMVNRYGEAIEFEGRSGQPIPPSMLDNAVNLIAWRIDRAEIPWHVWPKNNDGIQAILWHSEFQTEKACPGPEVKALTPEIIARVKSRLRQYQTGEVGAEPEPPPPPTYPGLTIPVPAFEALFVNPEWKANVNGPITRFMAETGWHYPLLNVVWDGDVAYAVTGGGLLRYRAGKVEKL